MSGLWIEGVSCGVKFRVHKGRLCAGAPATRRLPRMAGPATCLRMNSAESKGFREYNCGSMRVRLKAYLIWWGLVAAILLIGVAWALLRMGILFSIQIAPPDFTEASSRAWALTKFSLGVGALTMALIQVVRMLIPIRGCFHRQQLLEWLDRYGRDFEPPDKRSHDLHDHGHTRMAKLALSEFETRGGTQQPGSPYTRDFYDSSIEQLCAQLNVAIEAGLDSPRQMRNLLRCFFGKEGSRSLAVLRRSPPQEELSRESKRSTNDAELLRKAEARASLTRLAQFRIDAFQIETAGRWRRHLRSIVTLTSVTLSFAVTAGSIWHSADELNRKGQIASVVLYSALEGLIAAFVAMFLRDLVAIVETRRRRS